MKNKDTNNLSLSDKEIKKHKKSNDYTKEELKSRRRFMIISFFVLLTIFLLFLSIALLIKYV